MSVAVDTKNTQCERLSYHNFFIPYGFGVPSVRALLTDILLTSLIQFVQDTESNYSKWNISENLMDSDVVMWYLDNNNYTIGQDFDLNSKAYNTCWQVSGWESMG